jgi:prepilin-type processing-associated H-X9-DG protein
MAYDPLEYVASLQAQGYCRADLARALREAGWNRRQVRYLLRGQLPPPSAAQPWLPRTLALLLLVGVALIAAAGAFRNHADHAPLRPSDHPLLDPPPGSMVGVPRSLTRASCLDRLRRVTYAQMIYCADHEGRFPAVWRWQENLGVYGLTSADFYCPGVVPNQLPPSIEYAMNQLCSGSLGVRAGDPGLVLLFEAMQPEGMRRQGLFPHDDGQNVGFADGHCAWRYCTDFKRERFVPAQFANVEWMWRQ